LILPTLGAQQSLRREATEGIAQQHPANRHDGTATVAPHCGRKAELRGW
jgi:hypothetical protein